MTENQVFAPVKDVIFIILCSYRNLHFTSSRDKDTVQINPDTIRSTAIAFKVSDGLTPAEKL